MQAGDDLRYNKTMKTATIVASMFVGLLLGTTVGIASAARTDQPTIAPEAPAKVNPQLLEAEHPSEPRVVTMPEVTVRGHRQARKAKVWTCSDWQDSKVGGRYKACDWK